MRYLLVWADYMSTGLRDEFKGPLRPADVGIDADLSRRLSDWVSRYERITPLEDSERAERMNEITALDEEGLAIARAIQHALGEAAKVSYFSEGTLKKVPV